MHDGEDEAAVCVRKGAKEHAMILKIYRYLMVAIGDRWY